MEREEQERERPAPAQEGAGRTLELAMGGEGGDGKEMEVARVEMREAREGPTREVEGGADMEEDGQMDELD